MSECDGISAFLIKVASGIYTEYGLNLISEITVAGGYSNDGLWTNDIYAYPTNLRPSASALFNWYNVQNITIEGFIMDPATRISTAIDMKNSLTIGTSYLRNNRITNFRKAVYGITGLAGGTLNIYNNIMWDFMVSAIQPPVNIIMLVYNNTFYNLSSGAFIGEGAAGTAIQNNIFHSVYYCIAGNITGISDYNDFYNYTAISDSGTPGANDITDDPEFMNASNSNFELTSTSPCRGAGNAAVSPAADIKGRTRVADDIGALEYQSFTSGFTGTLPTGGEPVYSAEWKYNPTEDRHEFYINDYLIGFIDNTGTNDVTN